MNAPSENSDNQPPRGIKLEQYPDYIHIELSLYGWEGWYIRLFISCFAIGTWFWFYDFWRDASIAAQTWIHWLPLLPLVAAVVVTYIAYAVWRNSTHIFLSQETLEVYRAPIWLPGNRRIDAKAIEQVYVRHYPRSSGRSIHVHLKLHNKVDVKLLRILYPLEHALFVEKTIENYLGINDRKVYGEYDPE